MRYSLPATALHKHVITVYVPGRSTDKKTWRVQAALITLWSNNQIYIKFTKSAALLQKKITNTRFSLPINKSK